MVPSSRTEGGTGTHLLSAKVRKTIQSIKEIVGNHSDADIYVALKETNMDPNETTQKLLNQGWFFVGSHCFFIFIFLNPTIFFGFLICFANFVCLFFDFWLMRVICLMLPIV